MLGASVVHPEHKVVIPLAPEPIVKGGPGSNFPHLSLLDSLNIAYIIGAKPEDHAFMFKWIESLTPETHIHQKPDETLHGARDSHDVPLNDSNFDYRVNLFGFNSPQQAAGLFIKY